MDVIGTGVAGLCAADVLVESGCAPLVLEVSDRIGGRVHCIEDFAEAPIELGAEEAHGLDNAAAELITALG